MTTAKPWAQRPADNGLYGRYARIAHWFPVAECYDCASQFGVLACSVCSETFCGAHQVKHQRECWT